LNFTWLRKDADEQAHAELKKCHVWHNLIICPHRLIPIEKIMSHILLKWTANKDFEFVHRYTCPHPRK
jgi:hypothetical protein